MVIDRSMRARNARSEPDYRSEIQYDYYPRHPHRRLRIDGKRLPTSLRKRARRHTPPR